MRFRTAIAFLLTIVATCTSAVEARAKYWDIDTNNIVGAGGGTTPNGNWSSLAPDWNTNSTGAGVPTTWTDGDVAIFAAGTNATGAYTVTVSGTQSLSGLTVEEGQITQNGGTLDFGGTFSAPIDIASGSYWAQNGSSSIMTGADGIVKTGAGTLVLRAANPFNRIGTGNQAYLTINGGVVDFTSDANLGAVPTVTNNGTALTIDGGTLRYSGTTSFALANNRGVNIGSGGATIDISTAAVIGLSAGSPTSILTGSGTLTKTGSGRLRLSTAQTTFTGKYVVKGGSLTIASEDALGAVPVATQADYFTLDGGGLMGDLATGYTLDAKRGIKIGSNGGYLAFNGPGLAPYDGIISGTQGGALRLTTNDQLNTSSTGLISLNSANTYNGPTVIESGMTLSVPLLANGGVNSAIGSSPNAAANLVISGGTLHYRGGATSTDRSFTLAGSGGFIDASGINNAALNFTSTAPIGGSGNGARILVLRGTSTGDNTFSPAIIDQGTGVTTLNKVDAGTWVLKNTANSYTGNTVISLGGRLKLGASGVIPDASVVQLYTSSVFDLNGYDETVRSINTLHPASDTSGTIALGTKTLTLFNPNGESYTAGITGIGGGHIVKGGIGKFTLSPATATYDGGVELRAGILGIGTSTALGTGTLVVNNSPTLAAATSTALSPTNSVTLYGNLTFDDSFTTTPGAITWGASGANKWTIAGGERAITVNTAAGGYGVTINQPIGQDDAGRGLVKWGNGKLTLGGDNTYTGATTVMGGTLSVSKTYFADWGGVLLNAGTTLNLNYPAGTPDTIAALFVDGAFHLDGTWGAIGSGAEHQTAQITGTGLLNVTPFEPPPSSQPLAGDFNNDGKVDSGDYLVWRKNNGLNFALPNDDGLGAPIRLEHFTLWQQHFGNTPGSGSSGNGLGGGTIPEPNSILLVLVAVAGMSVPFRRRQRDSLSRSGWPIS